MGVPVFNGNCSGSRAINPISGNPDRYSLGLQLDLAKMDSSAFSRKSCTFRMPIKLSKKQKLVIKNIEQDIKLRASQSVESKSSLEIFLAGSKSTPLIATVSGAESTELVSKKLTSDGIALESDCGQEIIVSGNLSVSVLGSGKGSVSTSPVLMTMEIVSCL